MNAPTRPAEEAPPGLHGAQVVVVEDDPAHAEAIRRAFEASGAGAVVSTVRTLGEFRRASAAKAPDLALVDLNLPDGQAIEILSSPPEEGRFPVVVMTSFGDEQVAVRAMKAGALDYVVKSPEAFSSMPRTVERALGHWRLLQERRNAQRRSQQVTRLYRLLSNINQAIVRVRDLEVLFTEACQIAVEEGRFRSAWVGLLEPGSGALSSWRQAGVGVTGPDDPGPARATLETGRRVICNDVRVDEAASPWRESALANCILAWAALPLRVEKAVVGSFCLTSSEPGVFDETEMELLDELAMDLSFAIEASRREAARAKAEAEVESLNASLETKVRERTEALEAANRELESFSYSVSHDLRAPLRAIDGFSRLLSEEFGEGLDERGRHLVDRIREGAQKMDCLVNDLLALSKLGRTKMKLERLDLGLLVRGVDAELRAASPDRHVELVVGRGLETTADPSLVGIVLQNLLGNAWKFTSRKSTARIEVGVEETATERVFYVRDDGAGFDMGLSCKLFEPFRRLHSADEFEGTGIGLAIVRRIVQRHGGRAWIEGAVGRGATVRFTLPSQDGEPREEDGP